MARYRRRGHYRRSRGGGRVWVREHTVSRAGGAAASPPRPRARVQWNAAPASWVVPNATCPVCGAEVYFYANEHGSRVFFDELGPPWPKHPCTSLGGPARARPAGVITPTVKRDGRGGGGAATDGRGRPLVVELVVRLPAGGTLLRLRSLQAGGQAKSWVSDSSLAVLSGQVVFVSADVMSYIDMVSMEPATAPLRYHHQPSLMERLFGLRGS